ncbi:MAG: hypothetical protein E7161_03190 [Firmicutes bacterium]|nr:hypothetical protein [Bacillota bacterium]
MRKCIEGIKKVIYDQVKLNRLCLTGIRFSEHQKTYFWTNENIAAYLDLVDFEGKDSALAVLASGDQTFNLITKGIANIDTFDTNKFTEYFALGFKRALILKYNYQEFCIITQILRNPRLTKEELNEVFIGLFPFMELKHRIFWQQILDYNYQIQQEFGTNLNLLGILSLEKLSNRSMYSLFFNNYLKDEESYEFLRSQLGLANISFTYSNAIDLPRVFSKSYDFILLSNILDYFYKSLGCNWDYEELQKYEQQLEPLLNDDGVIFLHYAMACLKDSKIFRNKIINSSKVNIGDLVNEEFITLPPFCGTTNGMILKRVTK